MNKEKKYDLIEGYLDGSLSGKALSEFEKAIKTDPKLEAEIALHKEIAEVTGGEKFNDLRSVLKNTNAEWRAPDVSENKGRVVGFSFMKMVTAAAAVVLFGILIWNFINPKSATSTELFATNFEPYQMVLTQRSLEKKSEELNAAISNYANKNFAEAEKQFAALAHETPEQPILKMYECNAALAAGHHESSIGCFEKLLTVPNLKEQATWYLGLTHLQASNLAEAKKVFSQIETGNYKYREALKIIESLN